MHTKARQAGGRSLLRPSCRTAEGRVAGCPGLDVAGAEARGVPRAPGGVHAAAVGGTAPLAERLF